MIFSPSNQHFDVRVVVEDETVTISCDARVVATMFRPKSSALDEMFASLGEFIRSKLDTQE
jgi:hypothetical protein